MKAIDLRDNFVLLVGDTHSVPVFSDILERLPRDMIIIQMGDFGMCVDTPQKLQAQLRYCEGVAKRKNQTVYVIRGNHDNPSDWPTDMGNVKLIEDYTILKFPNGTTAMCVGGGISIDRLKRRVGTSYWPEEVTTFDATKCWKVDILLMHDAPSYFNHTTEGLAKRAPGYVIPDVTLLDDCAKQREVIDKIVDFCKPKYIYSGHYHNSASERIGGIHYRCLDVNEVLSLDTQLLSYNIEVK